MTSALRAAAVAVVLILAIASSPPAHAEQPVATTPSLEPLVLEVRVGSVVAADVIPAIRTPSGQLFLPFDDLCEIVRFPIEFDDGRGVATGWFVHPERKFEFDYTAARATIDGETSSVPRDDVLVDGPDLFVERRRLESWFPLTFDFDSQSMTLVIDATVPLAFEKALEREKRRRNRRVVEPLRGAAYDVHQAPFRLWSPPVHDVELQGTVPTLERRPGGRRGVPQRNAYEVAGAGDLLFMSGWWRVRGNESEPLDSVELRLGRSHPGGEMLGPLRATEVAAGDVNAPTIPLLTRGSSGAGFFVSNFPLHRPTSFSTTSLEGMLDSGWEVELYHNDRFVGFAREGEGDEFAFDAPVMFGMNEYRLEFWGPYGEHRTRYERAYIGAEMVKQGEFHYRAHGGLHQRPLVDVSGRANHVAGYGEPQGSLEMEYGVFDFLSVFADSATTPLRDGQHAYGGGGVAAYSRRFTGTLRMDADVTGGAAGQATLQTHLLGAKLSGRHVQLLDGFASQEFPVRPDPLASRSEARLDAAVPLGSKLRLPTSLAMRHDRHRDGGTRNTVRGSVVGAFGRLGWSNMLTLRGTGETFSDLDGKSTLRWQAVRVSPGVEIGYRLRPDAAPTSAAGTLRLRLSDTVGARARVAREVTAADSWSATAGLHHRFEYFEWQLDGGYTTQLGFSAGMTLRTSFGPAPTGGGVQVSSKQRTTHGDVVAKVFRDEDLDGVADPDEPLLSDASVEVDGLPRSALRSDEEGRLLVNGATHRYTNLSLVPNSLRDPFDMPATEGVTVIGRPGRRTVVELPVVTTGQVDGTIRDQNGRSVPALKLELVAEDGSIEATTESAFDGFFAFDYVRPGTYRLRVSPDDGDQVVGGLPHRQVVVPPGGAVVAGQNLEVTTPAPLVAKSDRACVHEANGCPPAFEIELAPRDDEVGVDREILPRNP